MSGQRLSGKRCVITGAAAGIGLATARIFIREGAQVLLADRNSELVEQEAQALGPMARGLAVDIADSASVAAMVAATVKWLGGIDVLVNNAGYGIRGSVVTTPEAEWDALMAVNLKGVYLCCRGAIPVMSAQGKGVIVNTASNAASVGLADRAAYVASKGGVAALTRAMALDHAKENIRVNCVAPGVTHSSYFDRMIAEMADPEPFVEALRARAPMHRLAEPAEIANAILFLACEESSFATGSMLTIDGGMTAW
jgi:NAD(P)-dependent dehydrogenase (short-subunit alcohol dehydrogenase family)